MKIRSVVAIALSSLLLTACVTVTEDKDGKPLPNTMKVDPLSTKEGRDNARDAYIQLALGYLQDGQTERAKDPLQKALKIDPNSPETYSILAFAFQREMEYDLADENFRKALSKERSARFLNNYASFLLETKQYQKSYDTYAEASKDPLYANRSRIFENMGIAALAMDKKDLAEQHFIRALRLNNTLPIANLELAEMKYNSGDYAAARSYYADFQVLSDQFPRSLLLGIRIAKAFNDRNQVATLALQLRNLYPGSPELKQYLAEQ
ncbi:type IV pilus biogenesis/stability protein PilW [Pseudomonas sp. F1_0610]|uniref:type IV pilus biogenesis/stability protein PilW n=1 Tax=Pseudomonas sp. F1_0610 TaxID=3114284 RepID=UPI0039C156C7